MSRSRLLPPLLLSLLTACGTSQPPGAVDVTLIADRMRLGDPDRVALGPADAVVGTSVARGLVTLDAQGQVEPALAESWITTEDGLSTIFRIRTMTWSDGSEVTAEQVAASLNRALADESRNRLKPLLSAVDTVVPMTGRVVEVRLKTPRPNLLQLLAQPELGIRRNGRGTGPYRVARFAGRGAGLVPVVAADDAADLVPHDVDLRTDRAARAIVRFAGGQTDLVMGGTLTDWPYLQTASLRAGRLRTDPVVGLFGLAVIGRSPFLATSDVRSALAMAIDRDAIVRLFGAPGLAATDSVLPSQLDSAASPAKPAWSGQPLAQRQADARERVARWRVGGREPPVLRIAMPAGPGMRLLFARLHADWAAIGVRAVLVAPGAPDVDLRLIDQVAPNASANWVLTTLSCAAGLVCDEQKDAALERSRVADTLAARAAAIADADADLTARASFIALSRPLRWSLVDPSLTLWRENAFAAHPLSELRPSAGTN